MNKAPFPVLKPDPVADEALNAIVGESHASEGQQTLSRRSVNDINSIGTTKILSAAGPPTVAGADALQSIRATASIDCVISTVSPARSFAEEIDPESDQYIQLKAHRLCQLWPFKQTDEEDVTQELRLAWLLNRGRFRPHKGRWRSFLKTIIERTSGKLRKKAIARARRLPNMTSLDVIPELPSSANCRASASRPARFNGQPLATFKDHSQVSLDVQNVIKRLPPKMSEVCEALMHQTVAEISRDTGVAESTIKSRITAVRRRHERKTLRDFL